jgi:nucleotide-binding universal stress UspA family protein
MKPTVIVGYDRSLCSDRALALAGHEAAWRDGAAIVVNVFHFVAATNPVGYIPSNVQTVLEQTADEFTSAGAESLRRRHPDMAVDSKVVTGPTAEALAEVSRDADLLVLGNRGRGGFTGLLLGSVSMRALTLASCPTMIVRGTPRDPVGTVVLALDCEDPGEELMDFAFTEASLRKARLRVVTAWDPGLTGVKEVAADDGLLQAKAHALADIRTDLERRLNPWHAKHPDVHLVVEVAEGGPGAVLTALSQSTDLIVVGAHRRADGHLGMRPGPTVHTLLHHADCPVVVVPRA